MKKIVVIILLGAVICGLRYRFTSSVENINELILYGNVEIRQVTLGFQVPGKIVTMNKEEGDFVKEGEIIAEIDDSDYKNSLSQASALVKQMAAVHKDAALKYAKNEPLCKQNILASQKLDSLLRDKDKAEAEFGDVMFSLINAARLYKINPDNALERTNQKFIRRFNYIEEHSIKMGKPLTEMTLGEMDALWEEAKRQEQKQ